MSTFNCRLSKKIVPLLLGLCVSCTAINAYADDDMANGSNSCPKKVRQWIEQATHVMDANIDLLSDTNPNRYLDHDTFKGTGSYLPLSLAFCDSAIYDSSGSNLVMQQRIAIRANSTASGFTALIITDTQNNPPAGVVALPTPPLDIINQSQINACLNIFTKKCPQ